jgi:hypothetical protein
MIKLDWLAMKYYQMRVIVIPLVICMAGVLSEALVIPLIAFYMLSFSVNPFAVEEKGKLDNLYLTLPVTRKTIVNARFGLSLIMQFAGLIVGTAVTIVLSKLFYGRTILFLYKHSFHADAKTVFLILCGSLLLYAIMNLSMFPVLFKIGYAKGKAIGFYIPVVAFAMIAYIIIMLWNYNGVFHAWALSIFDHTVIMSVIMLAAAILIFTTSYFLSNKLYVKREF